MDRCGQALLAYGLPPGVKSCRQDQSQSHGRRSSGAGKKSGWHRFPPDRWEGPRRDHRAQASRRQSKGRNALHQSGTMQPSRADTAVHALVNTIRDQRGDCRHDGPQSSRCRARVSTTKTSRNSRASGASRGRMPVPQPGLREVHYPATPLRDIEVSRYSRWKDRLDDGRCALDQQR